MYVLSQKRSDGWVIRVCGHVVITPEWQRVNLDIYFRGWTRSTALRSVFWPGTVLPTMLDALSLLPVEPQVDVWIVAWIFTFTDGLLLCLASAKWASYCFSSGQPNSSILQSPDLIPNKQTFHLAETKLKAETQLGLVASTEKLYFSAADCSRCWSSAGWAFGHLFVNRYTSESSMSLNRSPGQPSSYHSDEELLAVLDCLRGAGIDGWVCFFHPLLRSDQMNLSVIQDLSCLRVSGDPLSKLPVPHNLAILATVDEVSHARFLYVLLLYNVWTRIVWNGL